MHILSAISVIGDTKPIVPKLKSLAIIMRQYYRRQSLFKRFQSTLAAMGVVDADALLSRQAVDKMSISDMESGWRASPFHHRHNGRGCGCYHYRNQEAGLLRDYYRRPAWPHQWAAPRAIGRVIRGTMANRRMRSEMKSTLTMNIAPILDIGALCERLSDTGHICHQCHH